MKFKVKKVSVFHYHGKTYIAGDIVNIAEEDVKRLTPSDFLEPVKVKTLPTQSSAQPQQPEKPEKLKPLEKTRKKAKRSIY
jgi:hypothetical protein